MKPVYQTQIAERAPDGTGIRRGDCLMACLASILEVSLSTLPELNDTHDDGSWWTELVTVTAAHGYRVVHIPNDPPFLPPGYHIGSGTVPPGWTHAVVALDGRVVHNPFPGAPYHPRIERWYLLFPQAVA